MFCWNLAGFSRFELAVIQPTPDTTLIRKRLQRRQHASREPTIQTPGSVNSADCIAADAGSYVANSGSAEQLLCPVGTYQPAPGQSSCIDADFGYHVPNEGSTGQIGCSMGSYQDREEEHSATLQIQGTMSTLICVFSNCLSSGNLQPFYWLYLVK